MTGNHFVPLRSTAPWMYEPSKTLVAVEGILGEKDIVGFQTAYSSTSPLQQRCCWTSVAAFCCVVLYVPLGSGVCAVVWWSTQTVAHSYSVAVARCSVGCSVITAQGVPRAVVFMYLFSTTGALVCIYCL